MKKLVIYWEQQIVHVQPKFDNEAGVNSSGGSGGSGSKKRNNDGALKKADEALDKISILLCTMVESQKFLGDILKQLVNNNSSTIPHLPH